MTIRIPSSEIESIKQQNNKFKIKFEEKVTGFINYQDNLLTAQIDNIKQTLSLNQERMFKQKLAIDQLSEKISVVQARTEAKILLLSKELQNFRAYYDQCFKYTIVRVNEISSKMNQFSQELQNQMQNSNIVPILEYVKYTHDLVKQILKDSSLKTTDLKYYIEQQVYQLELELAKFNEYTESIEKNMTDLQMIQYGNASLQEVLKQTKTLVDEKNQITMKDSMMGKKLFNFYESKFKQIIKKINSLSIQIDIAKLLITSENNQNQQKNQMRQKECLQYEEKLKQLEKSMQEDKSFYEKQQSKKQKEYLQCEEKLKDAQKSLEQQKSLFEKQLVKKQQVLKKRHERILQLEQSVHALLEKQISMQHQISKIKLHNLELIKQIKQLNEKQKAKTIDSQTTVEKSSKGRKQDKSVIEQKLYHLQSEYDNLYKKYKIQEEQLKKLSRSPNKEPKQFDNMSHSQRFLRYQKPQVNISFRNERSNSKSISKILNKNQSTKSYNIIKGNNSQELDYQIIIKQNQKLSKNNGQLMRIKKQLEDQIDHLLNTKTNQNKQEEAYLDQVEAEIYKNSLEIERLQKQNLKLTRKNAELQAQNHRLQLQFNNEHQKYQLRAKVTKNTIIQLQRQNQALKLKNSQLLKQLNQIQDKDERMISQTSRNMIRLSVSPNKKKLITNTNELQDRTIYKTKQKNRRMSTFLINLQNAISSMGFPIPMCVEIDKSGFVRQRKTGSYLVDQTKTPLHLSEYEVKAALESGLILI